MPHDGTGSGRDHTLGVKAIHIPGSRCIGLVVCQPLDASIGIGSSLFNLKNHVHHMWEEWMMDMLDTDGKIKEATSCNEVTEWVAACGILGLTATGKRCLEFRIGWDMAV
jgi:hypothetical protein